jgi:hypothetical protein
MKIITYLSSNKQNGKKERKELFTQSEEKYSMHYT